MPDGYDTGHPFQDWWHRVSDGWQDFIGRAKDYFDQSQVGNNATAELGQGIASGATSPEDAFSEVINVAQGNSASSNFDLSSIMGSSAYESSDALKAYYEMYLKTGNEAYLEKLIDSVYDLENVKSARDYDKMMSDSAVSRMMDDIKKSGFNPWLALQNSIGSASSGSSVMASSRSGATSQETSAKNTRLKVNSEIASNVLRALLMIAIFALKG